MAQKHLAQVGLIVLLIAFFAILIASGTYMVLTQTDLRTSMTPQATPLVDQAKQTGEKAPAENTIRGTVTERTDSEFTILVDAPAGANSTRNLKVQITPETEFRAIDASRTVGPMSGASEETQIDSAEINTDDIIVVSASSPIAADAESIAATKIIKLVSN